jgi:tRNA modification GTPase
MTSRLYPVDDTIVAISTPPGRSGVGMVRLSGPGARAFIETHFRTREPFEDRRARYGTFVTASADLLDQVVVTFFEGPHSYTGEDVAEIGAHGNPLILNEIVRILVAGGARRAGPGEFTLRAVGNGRIDLSQAEAIRDFIEAQTESQARTAMAQVGGSLSRRVREHKEALVGIIAELEAAIDFTEDDVTGSPTGASADRLKRLELQLNKLADTFQYGRLLNDGLRLAILGKPNVGKSSLFNRLLSHDRAIVTEVAGTTRDILTETVAIGGIPIRFSDTAGLREARDPVEALGVERTLETLAETDLSLVVLDGSRELDSDDEHALQRVSGGPHIVVVNKQDLPARWEPADDWRVVRISALEGTGLDALEREITSYVVERRPSDSEDCVITNERQRDALAVAVTRLQVASVALSHDVPHEMVLLDLYGALTALGELTGEVTTEDILGRIFSTFCVGK